MPELTPDPPRRKSAHALAAERQARAEQLRREDDILAAAAQLAPGDDSLPARHLRAVAAQIADHRAGALRRAELSLAAAEPVAARLLSDQPWQFYANGQWATRRQRLWRLPGGVLAAMHTESPHDTGPTITNSVEAIAAKVAMEHPGEHVILIEHYPASPALRADEHFDLVTHLDTTNGIIRWAEIDPDEVIATYGDLYEKVPYRTEPHDPYDDEQR